MLFALSTAEISSRGLRAAHESAFCALLIGQSRAVECYVITARMLYFTCHLSKKNAVMINGIIGQASMDGYNYTWTGWYRPRDSPSDLAWY